MNVRKRARLGPKDIRLTSATPHAAVALGCPFTAHVSLHFGKISPVPADPGVYLRRSVVNWLGGWFRNRGIVWTAVWVRENFVGPNREHVHLLIHVPRSAWGAFCAAARKRWPEPGTVNVQRIRDAHGLIRYLSKQLSPQAHFAFRDLIRRQRRCPYTGAPVAPVLGRPYGMTDNLKARIKGSIAG